MEGSLYILIPLSLLLVLAIGLIMWWAVRSGQFDDLEGPGFRILMDDDLPRPDVSAPENPEESPEPAEKSARKDDQSSTLV